MSAPSPVRSTLPLSPSDWEAGFEATSEIAAVHRRGALAICLLALAWVVLTIILIVPTLICAVLIALGWAMRLGVRTFRRRRIRVDQLPQ